MSPCEPIEFDGIKGVICSRRRRARCRVCREFGAELLCDYPVPSKHSRTCDAGLCHRCAVVVGEDRHQCPSHPKLPPEPHQPGLPGVDR